MDTDHTSVLSHRVLYNHDLLHDIFSWLHHRSQTSQVDTQPHDKPGVEEATLARAARVCKTFADPALEVLWSSLPTLLPLWLILKPLSMMSETVQPPQDKFKYVRSWLSASIGMFSCELTPLRLRS